MCGACVGGRGIGISITDLILISEVLHETFLNEEQLTGNFTMIESISEKQICPFMIGCLSDVMFLLHRSS